MAQHTQTVAGNERCGSLKNYKMEDIDFELTEYWKKLKIKANDYQSELDHAKKIDHKNNIIYWQAKLECLRYVINDFELEFL